MIIPYVHVAYLTFFQQSQSRSVQLTNPVFNEPASGGMLAMCLAMVDMCEYNHGTYALAIY